MAASASAVTYEITIETMLTEGQLAFDLLGFNGAPNSVTISNFSTDGTLAMGPASTEGGPIDGVLPDSVTIENGAGFNNYSHNITFGTTISFFLELTENRNGSVLPDSFAFFLLDLNSIPLFATDDPFGVDALFAIDIDGSPTGDLSVFAALDVSPPARWTVTPVTLVPEPNTLFLLVFGLCAYLHRERFRKAGH